MDKIILQRADYEKLRLELARNIEGIDSIEEISGRAVPRAGLGADRQKNVMERGVMNWARQSLPSVNFGPDSARIFVPTAEQPFYEISLAEFYGGRRLLSDETAMLEAVSLVTARRIDALRVSNERFRQHLSRAGIRKIGDQGAALGPPLADQPAFPVQRADHYRLPDPDRAPDKAFETLMRLTQLLRGVLNSTGEFCTLGQELKLIESYLEIERARFEERLQVEIDVPKELREASGAGADPPAAGRKCDKTRDIGEQSRRFGPDLGEAWKDDDFSALPFPIRAAGFKPEKARIRRRRA